MDSVWFSDLLSSAAPATSAPYACRGTVDAAAGTSFAFSLDAGTLMGGAALDVAARAPVEGAVARDAADAPAPPRAGIPSVVSSRRRRGAVAPAPQRSPSTLRPQVPVFLKLPAGALVPGAAYAFALRASNGAARVSVVANDAPTGGVIEAAPATGLGWRWR